MTNRIDARNGCYGKEEEQEARDRETMRKDFEWSIYKECDREDAEEATADDGIDLADTLGNSGAAEYRAGAPRSAQAEVIAPAPTSPKYDGNLLPAMTAMVTGFVDKLAKFYSPCPQGDDCAGDGKHYRIFACDHCSFVGCCACLDLHEAGGHESDSSTARERIGYEY